MHCDDCDADVAPEDWQQHLVDEHATFVTVPRPDGTVAFGEVVYPKRERLGKVKAP